MSDWPEGWYQDGPGQRGTGQDRAARQAALAPDGPSSRPGSGHRARPLPAGRGWPDGGRPPAEILGPARPPRAADRPDRWLGRGGLGGGTGRLVPLAGLEAEPVGHAAGLCRAVRRAELADRRVGQPEGTLPAADRPPACRRGLRHRELRLPHAPAHRRRPAGPAQHPARLLRADPRLRRQQDQRGPGVRRPIAARQDR